MLSWVGPISDIARSKQRAVISAIRFSLAMCPWYFTNSWNMGSWLASWKPPRPCPMVPVSG